LPLLTFTRTSSPLTVALPTVILLQLGAVVTVGVLVEVGVSVLVAVGVGVSVGGMGVGVSVGGMGVGVSVGGMGVSVSVGTGVGGVTNGLTGIPTTRAVRNCSTIPVRWARRCRSGQKVERIGVING